MTSLAKRKSKLSVEFSDTVRERGKWREIVMDFNPYGVKVRLKGMRSSYEMSAGGVYNFVVRAAVERVRSEKKARKRNVK